MHHSTERTAHITAFGNPVVEDWLEHEIAKCINREESIRRHITPPADALPRDEVRGIGP